LFLFFFFFHFYLNLETNPKFIILFSLIQNKIELILTTEKIEKIEGN